MSISLIFIPILLIILLNIPKLSGKVAYWTALAFFAYQLVSVFCPFLLGSAQFAKFLTNFFPINSSDIFADGISKIMLSSAAIVAFVSLITSKVFAQSDRKLFLVSNLMLLAVAGINGLVFARDIFTLYVFIEIIAVASYIMIALDKTKGALEGGFKYLIISSIATVMMLFSVALFFLVAGATGFTEISAAIKDYGSNPIIILAVLLFVIATFIKGGLIPFHGWLSGAYSQAPAGVSVFLGGIVTKTTGIFTLIRLLYSVTGWTHEIKAILLVIGAVTLIAGALVAIVQKDFKKVLAFSSISQMGYIVLALGAGTSLGVAAALFHLFNHAIFKSTLFVNSAAVEKETGRLDLDTFGGLGYKMPITSFTSSVSFLSASGIPPFAGFWSKLLIIIALWTASYHGFAIVAILASLLTMGYFLTLTKKVFFGELNNNLKDVKEAPKPLTACAVALTAITIAVGILFPLVLKNFILTAAGI